jgi:hypothetical protein
MGLPLWQKVNDIRLWIKPLLERLSFQRLAMADLQIVYDDLTKRIGAVALAGV